MKEIINGNDNNRDFQYTLEIV